jgi:alanyl-tRNA synthetase
MKNKLYYIDPYLKEFSTNIIKQVQDENGTYYVILEETAFYPTGGGQPYDTGTLNNIPVINVEEIEGEIRHYIESPLTETSKIVGEIDWNRRFDHMQQHTGQHILSAAFEQLFGHKTVGFHLGQEIVTIDLAVENLSMEECLDVEKLANRMILENRPIITKWISAEEISDYPLRKELSVTENIRLVIIPEFDYNGCGGTHPSSTGQVGAIKILNWEKQRNNTRLQFVCGNRALKQLHEKQNILLKLTKLLNSPESGLVDSLTRLIETAKANEKSIDELQSTVIEYEARQLLTEKISINKGYMITKVLQNRTMKELQKLARTMTSLELNVIVNLVAENNQQLQVVMAKGHNIEMSMKDVLNKVLPLINGKGGGSADLAQGGGEATLSGLELTEKIVDILTT